MEYTHRHRIYTGPGIGNLSHGETGVLNISGDLFIPDGGNEECYPIGSGRNEIPPQDLWDGASFSAEVSVERETGLRELGSQWTQTMCLRWVRDDPKRISLQQKFVNAWGDVEWRSIPLAP